MYIITYEDDTKFMGGNPENSKWNEIEDKPIKSIEYTLNKTFTLSNFEQYNHIVKKGLFFSPNSKDIIFVEIMGLYKNKVYKIVFDFLKKQIRKEICEWGKEYNNKSHSGWKKGIISNITPTIN